MADAEIKTILTANTANFEAGLQQAVAALNKAQSSFNKTNKQAESSFKSLEKAARGLGVAFGVGTMVQFGRQVLDVADKLQTLQDRTGVSGSLLRRYQADVENSGGSLEELGKSISKMQINLGKATGGSKSAADAFRAIGLEVSALKKLSPERQFETVAAAISNIKDPAERAAAAVAIFGKGAIAILPSLDKIGEGAKKSQGFIEELTDTMGPDTIQTLDDFGDSLNTLAIQLTNLAATGLANVINTFRTLKYQIAEVSILAQKSAGLIDKEVADYALEDIRNKEDAIFNPTKNKDPLKPKTGEYTDPDKLEEATKNAEKLREAIAKLQSDSTRDILGSGLDDTSKKLLLIDFQVKDLQKQFKTPINDVDKQRIETTKENIRTLDEFNRKQKDAEELARDLGGAFNDAFEDGISGAESFSDVLGSLAKQLQKIAINQFISKPLNDTFGSIFQSASKGFSGMSQNGGGLLDSLGGAWSNISSIFGYATGIDKVPYDQDVRLHRGERVMTKQETEAADREGSKGMSAGPSYNIDARGAGANELRELRGMMIALAGPGVIERRVSNAQTRGAL
jgi:hypothetical protein